MEEEVNGALFAHLPKEILEYIIKLAVDRVTYLHKKDIHEELFKDTIYLVYRDERIIPFHVEYIFAERIPDLIPPDEYYYYIHGLQW